MKYPDRVDVEVTFAGEGKPTKAARSKKEGCTSEHDLAALAEAAGLLDADKNPVLRDSSHVPELTSLLDELTRLIEGTGCYPVPLGFDQQNELKKLLDAAGEKSREHGSRRAKVHAAAGKMVYHLLPDGLDFEIRSGPEGERWSGLLTSENKERGVQDPPDVKR